MTAATLSRPWYATNARNLLELRQRNLKPAEPVVVSLVGGDFRDVAETVLYARRDMPVDRMDWRMLVNLPVWVWADSKVPLQRLLASLDRIARCRPAMLILRFERDGVHDVEVGTGTHIPAVLDIPADHRFEWVPINLSGTATGAKLRKALIYQNPRWTVL